MSSASAVWSYLETGQFFAPAESAIIRTLIDEKDEADQERRRMVERRLALYHDAHLALVRSRLKEWLELENFVEVFKTIDISSNPFKRIVTEISNVYDKPASWSFGDAEDDDDQDDQAGAESLQAGLNLWKHLLKEARWNLKAPEINRLTNSANTTLVKIGAKDGKLTIRILTPDLIVVEQDPDDPTQIIALRYFQAPVDSPELNESRDPSEHGGLWHYWDKIEDEKRGRHPEHHIFDAKGRIVDGRYGVTGINPYRDENGLSVLPFAQYHKLLPVDAFWNVTSGDELSEGSLVLCVLESIVNNLVRVDGYAQRWISGDVDSAMGGQVAGPNRFITLRSLTDKNVSTGQWASGADWKGLRQVCNDKAQILATANGLSLDDFLMTGNPSSGFALRVRKEGLLEIRRRQIPLYECWDQEFYGVCAAVWNFERTNKPSGIAGKPALPWPSVAEPQIKYAAVDIPMTVQERKDDTELAQVRMSMGLESPLTVYLKEHPDESEEQAIATIQENIEWMKALTPDMLILGRAQTLPLGSPAPATQPGGSSPAPGGDGSVPPKPGQSAPNAAPPGPNAQSSGSPPPSGAAASAGTGGRDALKAEIARRLADARAKRAAKEKAK